MSPVLWMLVGVGISGVLGVLVFAVIERDFRDALGQVAAALFLAPTVVIGALVRRSPRAMRLSPEALKRFAGASTGRVTEGGLESAWLLAYRDRGVILVRRRRPAGVQNNVAETATRARNDTRATARVVADASEESR